MIEPAPMTAACWILQARSTQPGPICAEHALLSDGTGLRMSSSDTRVYEPQMTYEKPSCWILQARSTQPGPIWTSAERVIPGEKQAVWRDHVTGDRLRVARMSDDSFVCVICPPDGNLGRLNLDVFFFFTLVTGPRRSLSLKLSDTKVYAPQIPGRRPR